MKTKSVNRNLLAGTDIAIPGSEMFDTLENLGIEEEEYDFYSFGGDDHNNLLEDTGERNSHNYQWFVMTLKGFGQNQSD